MLPRSTEIRTLPSKRRLVQRGGSTPRRKTITMPRPIAGHCLNLDELTRLSSCIPEGEPSALFGKPEPRLTTDFWSFHFAKYFSIFDL